MSSHERPRRNFNPRKSPRYGRLTFDPDTLVKYSPKWGYCRLFNFPFRGSHFRPQMHTLVLSIDGGCRGNDRENKNARAAYAVYWGPNHHSNHAEILPSQFPTDSNTSNRAELSAAIDALRFVEYKVNTGELDMLRELIIKTDSEYVAKSMDQWVWNWERNGWKTTRGDDVRNRDLMFNLHERILRFEQAHRIHVRFWRVGREWNVEADGMVNALLDEKARQD